MNSIPRGYCQCGCGQKTSLYSQSKAARGIRAGEPARFRPGHYQRTVPPKETPIAYEERDCGYETPCHLWTDRLNSDGYAVGRGKMLHTRMHRHLYEKQFGPVGRSMELHHLCRQRSCIRLDHLALMTKAEHMVNDGRTKVPRSMRPCNACHRFVINHARGMCPRCYGLWRKGKIALPEVAAPEFGDPAHALKYGAVQMRHVFPLSITWHGYDPPRTVRPLGSKVIRLESSGQWLG